MAVLFFARMGVLVRVAMGIAGLVAVGVTMTVRVAVLVTVRVLVAVTVIKIVRVLVLCGSVGVMAIDQHAGLARGDAAAIGGFEAQCGAEAERGGGLFKECRRDSGFDQRSEEHVTTDAGKTFQISNPHIVSL
jgi:hypothetical protein